MVAVVLPSLKFLPPASETESACAFAHAGSAAPAAGAGALATFSAVTVSAADPLNLIGIVVPGERVPAISGRTLSFRDGVAAEPVESSHAKVASL